MYRPTKVPMITFIVVLLVFLFLSTVNANSAEPPSILIMVSNAPKDLEITIGEDIVTKRTDKVIESYFTSYSRELRNIDEYYLNANYGGDSFRIDFNEPLNKYFNVYTLNLKNQTLIEGKSLARSITLVSLRVTLTLILEAFVFFLLGFRERKFWIAFLLINLITQGGLNIWLNSFMPMRGYLIIALVFGEVLIFVAELIGFSLFVNEQRKLKVILHVLLANLLSLILGGYIITVLPV